MVKKSIVTTPLIRSQPIVARRTAEQRCDGLRDVLPVDTKTKLYNAFVLPHLDYCCVLWYECSKELQHRVDQIQNYGMRLILSKPPGTPSEGLRQKLKWRNMFRLVLVHR